MDKLANILAANWSLGKAQWQLLPSGHTNSSYILLDDEQSLVLRASWPHKPLAQTEREATVLAHLETFDTLPATPRLRSTHDGRPCACTDDGRWLHVFERIDGTPGLPANVHAGTEQALRALALLHHAMAELSAVPASTVAWLLQRHRRVSARTAPPMAQELAANYTAMLQHMAARLSAAADWIPGPAQWLHGDIHPGNLLFLDGRMHGIVDFDEVGLGSPRLELAFALFACSRQVSCEDHFEFDRALWIQGLHAYADAYGDFDTAWLVEHLDGLLELFCIDQALIHLEAAQRKLWSLTSGIGFLACWQHLQNQVLNLSLASSAR